MKKYLSLLVIAAALFTRPMFSVQAASGQQFGGYIDSFEQSESKSVIKVQGWAYNPNHPEHDVRVLVSVGGHRIASLKPEARREDVVKFTGVSNTYGFVYELPISAFSCSDFDCSDPEFVKHGVQFLAEDQQTGEQFNMHGGDMNIARSTLGVAGYIDRVSEENPQNPEIFVRGWAANLGFPSSDLDVYIMSNGELVGQGNTSVTRTDVQNAYDLPQSQLGFAIPVDIEPESSTDSGRSVLIYTFDSNTNLFTLIGAEWYEFED